jgi:hypothetical protein
MTLAEELMRPELAITVRGRVVRLEEPPLQLLFNGRLSADEMRMADQCTFDGPASWEE